MQRNLLHYQRALFLRKKKGYSYNEILAEVPVAKSTLSLWLHSIALSQTQQERLRNKRPQGNWNLGEWNRKTRQAEVTRIRVAAKQAVGLLSKRDFLIAGIMLHWAEGNKGGKLVQISNADPSLIRFIMHWFRTFLPITEDRFRASIHYHEGQNELLIKEFWSKITGIPLSQFHKSFKKPPGTGHRKHYLQWGVMRVHITRSADLFHTIAGWKDGLIKQVISGKQKGRP
ncbi:MAG: hypothetical protein WD972_03620 [Candidatus Andersenbacteria bacterium]